MAAPITPLHRAALALFMAFGCTTLAQAAPLDLRGAIEQALQAEAQYRAIRAENAAMQEELPRARAGLLPQLSASATRTDNSAEITQTNILGQKTSRDNDYISKNYALTLRQPILRYDSWIKYEQADTRVAYSDQQVEIERLKLVQRIGESYLNCLYADAVAQFARSEIDALTGLAESARRGFDAGINTRTDVLDAEARLDNARVRQIEARHAIDAARRTLSTAVGQPVVEIRAIDPARLTLAELSARIDDWQQRATDDNPEVAAARLALDLARSEIRLQNAGHLPSVDMIAQRNLQDSDSVSTIGSRTATNLWGFQVNLPIFSGGYVNASARQAAARLERAQAELDAAVEKIALRSARAADSLRAAAQRVDALARAEESASAALIGTEKGQQAGTRSFVDVLNARQQLFEVRQSRAKAGAEFILNLVELLAAAGQLDEDAIALANGFLSQRDVVQLNSN